jgi:hypothetical protein
MAARAASVGGIGHADASDGAREQNCHEKIPHFSFLHRWAATKGRYQGKMDIAWQRDRSQRIAPPAVMEIISADLNDAVTAAAHLVEGQSAMAGLRRGTSAIVK